MLVLVIILSILLIFSWGLFIFASNQKDGRLIIDETADSWTVSITTDPETIKRRSVIILTVDRIKARL